MRRLAILIGGGLISAAVTASSQQPVAYTAREVADGGTISGRVTLTGGAPAPERLEITKDREVCAREPKFAQDLVVSSENSGLRFVVVSITDIRAGKPWPSESTAITLDQNGCRFSPHILIVPAGQTFNILNNDGILHNVHTRSRANRPINKAQPGFLKSLRAQFPSPEIIRVDCDAHDWMRAWIVVAAHPYYAVTDENGRYRLENVPPGTYALEFWHERLGTQTHQVTVAANETAEANAAYPAR
ncbi:MAG: carboxypeptidase regulatory-like domain-containing protein [Gemmatimonadales bacterium]